MGKLQRIKMTSAQDGQQDRIMKFIQENREAITTLAPKKKSITILKKPPTVPKIPVRPKTDITSCLITTPAMDQRLAAGENNPAARKHPGKLPRTDSECQFKAPGRKFLTERNTNLAEQVLAFKPSKPILKELKNKCDFFPKYVDPSPFKDQITQTLYRESSAQTLAYLPEAWPPGGNHRELFTLPSVLPGDKPPGLFEVDVLERSRKRWSFYEALQINRKRLHLDDKKLMVKKCKSVMEAFEWEHWMEREEAIQECQMKRLEIVIKMFDKREREMYAASRTRMEQACERIEKRRQIGLRKNEIEFKRGVRRLKTQMLSKQPKWRKETPLEALASPSSEFYGPQIRYGVDPARCHFISKTGQRAFNLRMDKLEQQVIPRDLKCPLQKLNKLSQPKQYTREIESNISNEDNLNRVYKSLKALRHIGEFVPDPLVCLKNIYHFDKKKKSYSAARQRLSHLYDKNDDEQPQIVIRPTISCNSNHQIRSEEDHNEDVENMIISYEGSAIGSLMQFLWDETQRLRQLQKFHFFSMLAQKELWKREATEAGLREQENVLRLLYEEIFQHKGMINHEVTDQYISTILTDDVDSIVGLEAAEKVTEIAKQIDLDIERCLESFKAFQNPLTYVPLRLMLRDTFFPDINEKLRRHENSLVVQYIVEDVIFGRLWEELEPFDIATTLTSDWIDRLIDNDLYLFSTDSESESPQKTSWYEAQAIIRKLIRQSVPGRRWKEEIERIVYENYNDLLDNIFEEIFFNMEYPKPVEPICLQNFKSHENLNAAHDTRTGEMVIKENSSDLFKPGSREFLSTQVLSLNRKVTSILKEEKYQPQLKDRFVVMETFRPQKESLYESEVDDVHSFNAIEYLETILSLIDER